MKFRATIREITVKMEDRVARVRLDIPASELPAIVRVIAYAYGKAVRAKIGGMPVVAEVTQVAVKADHSSQCTLTLPLTSSSGGAMLEELVKMNKTVKVVLKHLEGGDEVAG